MVYFVFNFGIGTTILELVLHFFFLNGHKKCGVFTFKQCTIELNLSNKLTRLAFLSLIKAKWVNYIELGKSKDNSEHI